MLYTTLFIIYPSILDVLPSFFSTTPIRVFKKKEAAAAITYPLHQTTGSNNQQHHQAISLIM
jgi:hypothetical protein